MRLSAPACVAILATIAMSNARAEDRVPRLDTEQSCRAAAQSSISVGRSENTCRADEDGAHDALTRDWSNFSASDKSHCEILVRTGGPPSYVELLSCLEASRDARKIAQQRPGSAAAGLPPQTTGAGTPERR